MLANFLGSIFLAILSQTAWEQSLLPKRERRRVHIYLDEYSRFAIGETSASLLSEGGKLNLGLTIAHQTLSQIPDAANREAELQAGNLIIFQTTGNDAEEMVRNLTVPPEAVKTDPRKFAIIPEPVQHIKTYKHEDPYVNRTINSQQLGNNTRERRMR